MEVHVISTQTQPQILMKFYEILLRGDANGNYQGGHFIATPGGDAQPITDAQWPGVVKGLNDNFLATADKLNAERKSQDEATAEEVAKRLGPILNELETLKAKAQWAIEQSASAIADPSLDAESTVARIALVIAEVQKPEIEREREALLAEQAAIQERLAALPA